MPIKTFTAFSASEPLILESGTSLGPISVAYETCGTLNKSRSNAILVCHALTGDTTACGTAKKPGWWDTLIGPGKAIDTNKYFVICSNVLGSCYGTTGPSSINPKTDAPYGLSFPMITVGDMVAVQKALIDHLSIKTLHAVVGGSMGGMQVLGWSISHPKALKKAVIIAAGPKLTTQSLAFNMVGREAITSDPEWAGGAYEEAPNRGLSIARMLGHTTYRSNTSLDARFGRKLQKKADYGYDFSTDFEIESYLKHQGDKFVQRFDANAYLYLARAMSYFDIEKKYGDLSTAFEQIQSQLLIVSINSDWLYPPESSKEMVKTLMSLRKAVTYAEIDSPNGHDSFLMPHETLEKMVHHFIRSKRT